MAGVRYRLGRCTEEPFCPDEEVGPVSHAVAHEEVHDRRHREVDEDLDQCIDLVLLADRAEFEKGKAGVHGQDHDGAKKDKERVCALS